MTSSLIYARHIRIPTKYCFPIMIRDKYLMVKIKAHRTLSDRSWISNIFSWSTTTSASKFAHKYKITFAIYAVAKINAAYFSKVVIYRCKLQLHNGRLIPNKFCLLYRWYITIFDGVNLASHCCQDHSLLAGWKITPYYIGPQPGCKPPTSDSPVQLYL